MMSSKPGYADDHATTPSNNLWVGSLSPEVTDADLMDLFGRYGALSATTYSSRNFAFVYFKRMEDAMSAKEALQGFSVRGNHIKIEFARPAKQSNSLWVGGFSAAVTKEQLEKEFLNFGKIEDFKFLRERNTAFIEYSNLDDATQAMKSMNGERIGGNQIRVDFLRSQPSRREQLPPDFRDRQFVGPHSLNRPQLTHSSAGQKADNQPSNILWIGYPPSVHIEEQMLHNALILFGEIEKIKCYPSRNYSFVEFRSVEEARRAKEGLQGRLFNDPRITIMYSNSDQGPGSKDYPSFYPGIRGPRPDMNAEHIFGPSQMDMHGHNHPPPMPNNFPGPLPPLGSNDLSALHSTGPTWRRPSSPAPGLLPSPATGIRPPMRWDPYDAHTFERDAKRSRVDGALPIDDASFPTRNIDNKGLGLDRSYGLSPKIDRGLISSSQAKNQLSPVSARIHMGRPTQVPRGDDYVWRGIIAKGGTPVCRARCVPIGKGIGSDLPDAVNCSARTGLDVLTKHYAEAIGFDIAYFLPDSEDDFASYTEFLRYLGSKNRAGVAKLEDGTTLFLVPPSEFLTEVLKVTGPERLYGVVLKLPTTHVTASVQEQSRDSHSSIPSLGYTERQQIPPPLSEYNINPREEKVLSMGYNRPMSEESKLSSKYHSQGSESNSSVSLSKAGVTLTPELIATLTSLLPVSSSKAPASENVQVALSPAFSSVASNRESSSPEWSTGAPVSDSASNSLPKYGNQFSPASPQAPSQFQSYPSVLNHSSNAVSSSAQIQDSVLQHGVSSSRQTSIPISSQNGQYGIQPLRVNHPYSFEAPENTQHHLVSRSTQMQDSTIQHSLDASRPLASIPVPSQNGQYGALPPKVNHPYSYEAPKITQHHVVASSAQTPDSTMQRGLSSSRPLTSMPIPSQTGQYAPLPPKKDHPYAPEITQRRGTEVQGLYKPVNPQPSNHINPSHIHGPSANFTYSQNLVAPSAEPVNLEAQNHVPQKLPPAAPEASRGTSNNEEDEKERYQQTLQFAANLLLRIKQQQQNDASAGKGSGHQ